MKASLNQPRFYFLPLDQNCLKECEICFTHGCRNSHNRSTENIFQIIQRAAKGGHSEITFPASILLRSDLEDILTKTISNGLVPQLQIHWKALNANREVLDRLSRPQNLSLNIVFHCLEEVDWEDFLSTMSHFKDWHITISPWKISRPLAFMKSMPEHLYSRVYFHFSPFMKGHGLLTSKEAWILLSKMKKEIPSLAVRPPLGRDVWDPRIADELALDSDIQPSICYELSESPEISVVIPSFNSGPLLKNVLRHLLWQDLPRSQFEIIIVDDGSTDGNLEAIRNFIAPEKGDVNFKYLYFPRAKQRKRGDGNFRAGIARNQGVKFARGKILSFVDADIIVPGNFLRDLCEKHNDWDVIQCIRLHLKSKKENDLVRHSQIRPDKDTYVLESKYWSQFFQVKDWGSIPFFWKYTCTYGLSVKTADFKNAGWFRKTFVYYGFEDTDLGYRLANQGKKFLLNPMITYHIDTPADRTEYRQSHFERHLILSKTAKVFFLNTLDLNIFLHFVTLMGREKTILDHLGALGRTILRPLHKKKSVVVIPGRHASR